MSIYYIPGTLHLLTPVSLTRALRNRSYYDDHFTNEETGTEILSNLHMVTYSRFRKWQLWDLNAGSLTSEPKGFVIVYTEEKYGSKDLSYHI